MRFLIVLALLFAGCSQPKPFEPSPRLLSDLESLKTYYFFSHSNGVLSITPGDKDGQARIVFNRAWSTMDKKSKSYEAKNALDQWKKIHGPEATAIVLADDHEVILDAS